jgi:hypothetical protein
MKSYRNNMEENIKCAIEIYGLKFKVSTVNTVVSFLLSYSTCSNRIICEMTVDINQDRDFPCTSNVDSSILVAKQNKTYNCEISHVDLQSSPEKLPSLC